MTVTIVQGARASEPYRWKLDLPEEMRQNGVEPEVQLFGAAAVDLAIPYPGLPTLDGLTPGLDGVEPMARLIGVADSSSQEP